MPRDAFEVPLYAADEPDGREPHTADDRAYYVLMYEEHARQARHQEHLRTVWTATTAIVLPALMIASVDAARQWLCGVLICVTALVGILMQGKHQERYDLHLRVMRGFRGAFARSVRQEIPAISQASRLEHNRQFRPFRFISIRQIWAAIYVAALAVGATIAYRGEPPPMFSLDRSAPATVAAPAPSAMALPAGELVPGAKPQ